MSKKKSAKQLKPVTKKQLLVWWSIGIALAIAFPLINIFTNINGYSSVTMNYTVITTTYNKNFNVTFHFSKPTKGGTVELISYNTLIGETTLSISIPKSQYTYSKILSLGIYTFSLILNTYRLPAQWNYTTLPFMVTAALPMGYACSLTSRYKKENNKSTEISRKD